MSSVNSATISGRVTRDLELRTTPSGTSVADFGVAVSKSRKNDDGGYDEEVSFIDVTVWSGFAELLARKIGKGSMVTVQGELKQDTWETEAGDKRSKVKLVARQVDSPDLYKSGDRDSTASSTAPSSAPSGTGPSEPDDDIPF